MIAQHPNCPWILPSWEECRESVASEQHPCVDCPTAEHLRQEQQRRRADAHKGVR